MKYQTCFKIPNVPGFDSASHMYIHPPGWKLLRQIAEDSTLEKIMVIVQILQSKSIRWYQRNWIGVTMQPCSASGHGIKRLRS